MFWKMAYLPFPIPTPCSLCLGGNIFSLCALLPLRVLAIRVAAGVASLVVSNSELRLKG
jgi:hypothetical protein